MSDNINYYPVDVRILAKGHVFTIIELEKIFGVRHPHPYWGFKLLELRRKIKQQRRRLSLPRLTMRASKGTLVVLTDEQAAEHNERKAINKVKAYAQTVYDNIAVDSSGLPAAAREVHERVLKRQAFMMRALRHAQHAKPPELTAPPQRTTPAMLSNN